MTTNKKPAIIPGLDKPLSQGGAAWLFWILLLVLRGGISSDDETAAFHTSH